MKRRDAAIGHGHVDPVALERRRAVRLRVEVATPLQRAVLRSKRKKFIAEQRASQKPPRDTDRLPLPEEEAVRLALGSTRVVTALEGKPIRRVIYRQDRLLNLVTD